MADPSERASTSEPAPIDLDAARAALDAHLADPERAREDHREAGGLVRAVTIVMGAVAALAIAFAAYAASSRREALPIAIVFVILFSVLALVLFLVDLSIVPRADPSPPDAALKSYLKALAIGRVGYAWACLAPTARARTVSAPSLGELPTGPGSFSLARPAGLRDYLATFARAGHGQMRSVVIKRVRTVEERSDVARVEADMTIHAYPRWVSFVMALGFVLFRAAGPLIFVALVIYFVTRKRRDLTVVKSMIRGKDGAWYVADADILEGVVASAEPPRAG